MSWRKSTSSPSRITVCADTEDFRTHTKGVARAWMFWERWVSRSFWRLSLDEVIFFLGSDSRGARCSEPATFAFSAAWRLTE
jgi:hypothetical protein